MTHGYPNLHTIPTTLTDAIRSTPAGMCSTTRNGAAMLTSRASWLIRKPGGCQSAAIRAVGPSARPHGIAYHVARSIAAPEEAVAL